jgi:hypothetical protein
MVPAPVGDNGAHAMLCAPCAGPLGPRPETIPRLCATQHTRR